MDQLNLFSLPAPTGQDGYFAGGGGGGPAPPYPPSAKGQGGRGGGSPYSPEPGSHLNGPGAIANSGGGGGGGTPGGRSGASGSVSVIEAGGAPGVWSLKSQFAARKQIRGLRKSRLYLYIIYKAVIKI